MLVIYSLTAFLSAFLLFQVQPLLGRFILPWFGGTPTVWTVCMLFFQILLLFGYAYAHLGSTVLPPRRQIHLHLALLALSLLFLPLAPQAPPPVAALQGGEVWRIMQCLLLSVGIPYFLLSSTGPLIQHWFAQAFPSRRPYRLYALSNAGSLLALMSYPFVFEPLLHLRDQAFLWSGGFVLFVLLYAFCAISRRTVPSAVSFGETAGDAVAPVSGATVALWLFLSMSASAMLLATTNQLCQEVAVVPFLWVLPLALYLLSFILTFDSDQGYDRRWWGGLLLALGPVAWLLFYIGFHARFTTQLVFYAATLLVCCVTCHGELVRTRPSRRQLTLFYMVIATGGALGGILVALVAPALFPGFWEYPIALGGCTLFTLIAWSRGGAGLPAPRLCLWLVRASVVCQIALALSFAYLSLPVAAGDGELSRSRNFYGVLRVTEQGEGEERMRHLIHGRIIHGVQFLDPEKSRLPTSYFGEESAFGLAMRHHPRRVSGALRVGIIGLGIGTMAAYGEAGDLLHFYEINPAVVETARRHFSYLRDAAAEVRVTLGDARLNLEREAGGRYDILAVDAFSSDAIPVHLLTRECADLYWRHLKDDGLLLLHITNRMVDLAPVARGLADHLGCRAIRVSGRGDAARGTSPSTWVALTRNEAFLSAAPVVAATSPWRADEPPAVFWSDDFAGLWQVVRY